MNLVHETHMAKLYWKLAGSQSVPAYALLCAPFCKYVNDHLVLLCNVLCKKPVICMWDKACHASLASVITRATCSMVELCDEQILHFFASCVKTLSQSFETDLLKRLQALGIWHVTN